MIDTETSVKKCFKAVFGELSDDEVTRASTASVGSWDSVGTLSLFAVIEEELHVKIPTEMMGELISYELVLDYVKQNYGKP
jgi:acyl carrier protein